MDKVRLFRRPSPIWLIEWVALWSKIVWYRCFYNRCFLSSQCACTLCKKDWLQLSLVRSGIIIGWMENDKENGKQFKEKMLHRVAHCPTMSQSIRHIRFFYSWFYTCGCFKKRGRNFGHCLTIAACHKYRTKGKSIKLTINAPGRNVPTQWKFYSVIAALISAFLSSC